MVTLSGGSEWEPFLMTIVTQMKVTLWSYISFRTSLYHRDFYKLQGDRRVVADVFCTINCNIYRLVLSNISGSPALATLAKENFL